MDPYWETLLSFPYLRSGSGTIIIPFHPPAKTSQIHNVLWVRTFLQTIRWHVVKLAPTLQGLKGDLVLRRAELHCSGWAQDENASTVGAPGSQGSQHDPQSTPSTCWNSHGLALCPLEKTPSVRAGGEQAEMGNSELRLCALRGTWGKKLGELTVLMLLPKNRSTASRYSSGEGHRPHRPSVYTLQEFNSHQISFS